MRADGEFIANMAKSMERAAEYIEMAERGNTEGLIAALERNTLDSDRHPNQIILGLAMVMGSMRKGTGRSMIPAVKKAAEHWSKDKDNARLYGIWTP